MSDDLKVVDAGDSEEEERRALAHEVLVGLSSKPKRLSSRFFYDARGSELFQQIMALEEYYPTRCETEVLNNYAEQIVQAVDGPMHLVDLGAGDGAKTKILLRALEAAGRDVVYVPIDVSKAAIEGLEASLKKEFPKLRVSGVVGEYGSALNWLSKAHSERNNLILFLGSNIGNFPRAQALGFLGRLWSQMRTTDRLLVGFDLKKDIEVLLAAYNDKQGVTAAFNLNLLRRINRELGADFDLDGFRHYGTYDALTGAMTSYLVSKRKQDVTVRALEKRFHFNAWEPVHTEYSYKYLRTDIARLRDDSGFAAVDSFEESRGWFVDVLWQPVKGSIHG